MKKLLKSLVLVLTLSVAMSSMGMAVFAADDESKDPTLETSAADTPEEKEADEDQVTPPEPDNNNANDPGVVNTNPETGAAGSVAAATALAGLALAGVAATRKH